MSTLYHYGTERKDHKYIRKIRTASGNWRYIYDDSPGDKYSEAHGGSNRGQLKSYGGSTAGNQYAKEHKENEGYVTRDANWRYGYKERLQDLKREGNAKNKASRAEAAAKEARKNTKAIRQIRTNE